MTDRSEYVDRLWPDPRAGLELDDALTDVGPRPRLDRPVVGVNMVTSIDGRAQLGGTAEGLSGRADRRLMQLYRAGYDAVASGVGTLRADDFHSRLAADLAARREANGLPAQPVAVLIGGSGPVPVERGWFTNAHPGQRRVLAIGAGSPHRDHALPGVEAWVAPTRRPDPAWLLGRLSAIDVRSLLLEGGPTVVSAFLAADLIDELYWTIGARLIGTGALPMIAPVAGGSPFADRPREGHLVSVLRSGDELFLQYRFTPVGVG